MATLRWETSCIRNKWNVSVTSLAQGKFVHARIIRCGQVALLLVLQSVLTIRYWCTAVTDLGRYVDHYNYFFIVHTTPGNYVGAQAESVYGKRYLVKVATDVINWAAVTLVSWRHCACINTAKAIAAAAACCKEHVWWLRLLPGGTSW